MSDLRRGPVPVQTALAVPAVPAPVPAFCEAVPTGPHPGPQFAPTGPLSPPYRGDGGRARLGRRVSLTLHPCGQHVLVGLDDDMAALVVRVDPYPLSPTGEVAALRDHRPTYRLQHGVLERRDRWTIPGHLPSHHVHVLAEHRCGQHPPDDWLLGPGPRPATRPAPATEGMPF